MIYGRRVVITGMGVISPVGLGIPDFLSSLQAGRSGEGPITCFPAENFPVKKAFEVKGFDPHVFGLQAVDPFIQYAVAAADEALRDARFDAAAADPFSIGISVSSSKGGVHTLDRFRERLSRNPSAILGARVYSSAVPNFAAQWIARRWKIQGPAKCYVSACATGTAAVIEGMHMVASGVVDYCVAGASDASIVPLMLAGYRNMKALSPDAMRPFDRRRNGFLVGEGAGIVFLETLESAEKRGAVIYGEILGFGYGSDSTDILRFDEKEHALSRTASLALGRADLKPADVDYVNLHGTATPSGDLYESREMRNLFGAAASGIPMSATKSMTGHMLGASGAVEVITCLLAMKHGFVPPTVGLEEPDPECDLDYVPGKARAANVQNALSLSMGFGGHVAVLVLGKK